MVAKAAGLVAPQECRLVVRKPFAEAIDIRRNLLPTPGPALVEFPVDVACVPPLSAEVFAKMDIEEDHPTCLVEVPSTLLNDGGFQWIKALRVRIGSGNSKIYETETLDVFISSLALNHLLN